MGIKVFDLDIHNLPLADFMRAMGYEPTARDGNRLTYDSPYSSNCSIVVDTEKERLVRQAGAGEMLWRNIRPRIRDNRQLQSLGIKSFHRRRDEKDYGFQMLRGSG